MYIIQTSAISNLVTHPGDYRLPIWHILRASAYKLMLLMILQRITGIEPLWKLGKSLLNVCQMARTWVSVKGNTPYSF